MSPIKGGTWAFHAKYDLERALRDDPFSPEPTVHITRCRPKPLWATAGIRGALNHMIASGAAAWDDSGSPHLGILARCHVFLFRPKLSFDAPDDGDFCDACLVGDRTHGVYTFRDIAGQALYIGCTVNVLVRMREHQKSAAWWPEVASASFKAFEDQVAAYRAERAAILHERPRYNRQGLEHLAA